jgi:quercetin dioxygenase-like cupin family protein
MLGLTLAAGIAGGIIGHQLLSAQPEPVTRQVLLKTDLAGIDGKEGIVVLAEIAPGATTGKHYHPAHEFAYVLEGSLTLEVQGKPPVTLKPGGVVHQPPRQTHEGKNASRTDPVKILAFYLSEKGQPLTNPVK